MITYLVAISLFLFMWSGPAFSGVKNEFDRDRTNRGFCSQSQGIRRCPRHRLWQGVRSLHI